MSYCAFGYRLESDRPLPELPTIADEAAPHFTILWCDSLPIPDTLSWTLVWPELQSEPQVAFARDARYRYLRFENCASVRMTDAQIEIATLSGDAPSVRHLLLDFILPLALASGGETVLHGSAVDVDGHALVFIGDAGSGKSTIAAALAAHGATVLADDGVLLQPRDDGAYAVPSYPGLRLWPDAARRARTRGFSTMPIASGSRKRRLVPSAGVAGAAVLPVAGVYCLRIGDGAPVFHRLSTRDAALEVIRHAFTPDVFGRTALLSHLDRAEYWARRLDMWTITAGRDLSALDSLARRVTGHAAGLAARRIDSR